ncbi:chaplin [Streptomyces antibioticus]|uniref:Chaplin n=1 Tax=Streptomyces antibioticus TaxID=1890 RepID=A0AAE7CJY2_STRAT|nr:chaplin [Streptomyces antibioticus]OOQ53821.1 Tat pathway signal protein [Streptomyces antibioticus]QIT43609.1 chaplin [Streptomyces antibioticus]
MRHVTRKRLMTVAAATGVIAAAGGYAHADSGANGAATDSPGVLSGNSVQAPVNVPVNACGNTIDVVGILNPSFGNSCANKGGGGSGGYGGDQRSHGGHKGQGQGQGKGHGQGQHSGSSSGNHGGQGGNGGRGGNGGHGGHGGSGAQAGGHTGGSPGVGSGNNVQVPIDVPVNVCGNSIDVVGILNPTFGNDCANGDVPRDRHPGKPPVRGHENPGHQAPGQSSPTVPEGVPAAPQQVTPAHTVSQNRTVAAPQLAETGSELPLGLALPTGAGALLAGALLYRKARPAA